MTKKEKKRYDRMIDGIAESLVMSAYHEAIKVTDGVYLDILMRLRSLIDCNISRMQERNAQNIK